ncbi:hypothetical protein N3K66_008169 [Trichothecium roseum]|uniref:Uncharacterized protein n=1 Tax=Trichothecium roseum TaxID=47278 RepID=A0ACC0UUG4_9HYPO|nr:hypothetical protein N3K66_008169 [Trichothecium roseum]
MSDHKDETAKEKGPHDAGYSADTAAVPQEYVGDVEPALEKVLREKLAAWAGRRGRNDGDGARLGQAVSEKGKNDDTAIVPGDDPATTWSLRALGERRWSALGAAALAAAPVFLDGYQGAIIPGFYGYRAFREEFGEVDGGRGGGAHGYRGSAVLGLAHTFFFLLPVVGATWLRATASEKLAVLAVGEAGLGLAWGWFQGLTLPYISEVVPQELRAPAAVLINIFWMSGQTCGIAMLRAGKLVSRPVWAVRLVMFAPWPCLVLVGLLTYLKLPESPRWLAQKGDGEQLRRAPDRPKTDPAYEAEAETKPATMTAASACKAEAAGLREDAGFASCWRGTDRPRTEVVVGTYVTQQAIGSCLIFFSIQFLQKSGHGEDEALSVTNHVFLGCLAASALSVFLLRPRSRGGGWLLGRRRLLWLAGVGTELLFLAVIGGVGCAAARPGADGEPYAYGKGASLAISVFLGAFTVAFHLVVAPVCYAVMAEVPSRRLKAPTGALARAAFVVCQVAGLWTLPLLVDRAGAGPRAALLWCALGSLSWLWAYRRLPETGGRSQAEVDLLWEARVPAREWRGFDHAAITSLVATGS